jgi:hypothetical protein
MEKPMKQFILENDPLHSENNVYVYFRYTDKKTVMVVINNTRRSKLSKQLVFRKT